VYFKSIRRFIKNISCSEAFGVNRCSKAFPIVFFFLFVRNNKDTSDWQTEACQTRNNSKTQYMYFAWHFQLIFEHQLSFFTFKKPLKIRHYSSEANVVYLKTLFWSNKNEIRFVSWKALPSTWPKSTPGGNPVQCESCFEISYCFILFHTPNTYTHTRRSVNRT